MTASTTLAQNETRSIAQLLFDKYASTVDLLHPIADDGLRSSGISPKLGGLPYAEAGSNWPKCPLCEAPLAFVGQIPIKADLLQIYWCQKPYCQDDLSRSPFEFDTTVHCKSPHEDRLKPMLSRKSALPAYALSNAATLRHCDVANLQLRPDWDPTLDLAHLVAEVARLGDELPEFEDDGGVTLVRDAKVDHHEHTKLCEIVLPIPLRNTLKGSGTLAIYANKDGRFAVTDPDL